MLHGRSKGSNLFWRFFVPRNEGTHTRKHVEWQGQSTHSSKQSACRNMFNCWEREASCCVSVFPKTAQRETGRALITIFQTTPPKFVSSENLFFEKTARVVSCWCVAVLSQFKSVYLFCMPSLYFMRSYSTVLLRQLAFVSICVCVCVCVRVCEREESSPAKTEAAAFESVQRTVTFGTIHLLHTP